VHDHARRWVTAHAALGHDENIADIGGRNVNGSIRDLFPTARDYVTVDRLDGPGVDVVDDFLEWQPAAIFGLVLHLEVAEHTPDWRAHIAKAAEILRPGGALIWTCAGPDRLPHSAIDGGPLRDGEHYQNIHPRELAAELRSAFPSVVTQVGIGHPLALRHDHPDTPVGDLYAVAWTA